MTCPKCKKSIDYVRIYSEIWQKGYLEDSRVVSYGRLQDETDEATDVECPECHNQIEVEM